ncbi:MAG: hypothetical protein WB421_19640 [Terriglobales bacterium]
MTFKYDRGRGELKTDYGIVLGFTDFTASDGIGMRAFYLTESGRVRAATAFNEEVARAVKVFELAEKRDRAGVLVGKRALILAPSSKPFPPFPAVIWTNGATFHKVASSSMQDNLALEKVYRK